LKERGLLALRIGFTYIGTVVGAGFASGQEILRFFTVFGRYGTGGVGVATLLFSWLGTRMMLMGSRLKAHSYEEFNHYLFGERWGKWVSGFVGVVLFGVTTAMLSGTGALFEEQLGWSFHLGVLLTALLAYLVILKGMEGILSVNTLVVPLMFLFTVLVAFHVLGGWESGVPVLQGEGSAWSHWAMSAVSYVGLNLAMSQAVLVPLGAEIKEERTIRLGGWIGGLGLGAMLLVSHLALQLHWGEVFRLEIPMAHLINMVGTGMKMLFLAVMWGEIFTTLIGNVYGLAVNLAQVVPLRERSVMLLIFLVGYLFSLVGFPTLVSYVYPVFGYCGLLVLVLLVARRLPAW
jgi:uncharacterized membrane protein YkvI